MLSFPFDSTSFHSIKKKNHNLLLLTLLTDVPHGFRAFVVPKDYSCLFATYLQVTLSNGVNTILEPVLGHSLSPW